MSIRVSSSLEMCLNKSIILSGSSKRHGIRLSSGGIIIIIHRSFERTKLKCGRNLILRVQYKGRQARFYRWLIDKQHIDRFLLITQTDFGAGIGPPSATSYTGLDLEIYCAIDRIKITNFLKFSLNQLVLQYYGSKIEDLLSDLIQIISEILLMIKHQISPSPASVFSFEGCLLHSSHF